MHQLKRVTTEPNSHLRIMVSDPVRGDNLNSGGTFHFAPAGQDGDTYQVNAYVAKAIMTDPGMAPHFTCTPPVEPVTASNEASGDPAAAKKPTGRRARGQADQTET